MVISPKFSFKLSLLWVVKINYRIATRDHAGRPLQFSRCSIQYKVHLYVEICGNLSRTHIHIHIHTHTHTHLSTRNQGDNRIW